MTARLGAAGFPLGGLNVRRLMTLVASLADPWSIDRGRVLQAVVSGQLRATDIRPAPRREVPLTLQEGFWITRSALDPPMAGGNGPVAIELSVGWHVLFHVESAASLKIWVRPDGPAILSQESAGLP